jgi:hypothetical protein
MTLLLLLKKPNKTKKPKTRFFEKPKAKNQVFLYIKAKKTPLNSAKKSHHSKKAIEGSMSFYYLLT